MWDLTYEHVEHHDPRALQPAARESTSEEMGPGEAAPTNDDLVHLMRDTARWRRRKAREFEDDKIARVRSHRAMVAIQTAAKFVEALPADDRDLAWLRYIDKGRSERGWLAPEARELLSRFGMDRGAWTHGPPDETRVRNLLRRMAGAQSRERAAERHDAR